MLRPVVLVLAFTALCLVIGVKAADGARLVRVVDGDTFIVPQGRVRLIGIDTPERGECGYVEAANLLERILLNAEIRLVRDRRTENRDGYGRLLRYAHVGRWDVGRAMVAGGYAEAFTAFPFTRFWDYAERQRLAWRHSFGLWMTCGTP